MSLDQETQAFEPALYLIPVELSDETTDAVLPRGNTAVVTRLRHFIVENVRSARRFLKRCDRSIDIDALTFAELNGHTPPEAVARMLEPLEHGEPMGVISEAGCPAVADPGADVVAIAQRKGLKVVPLVGPSSIIMSLMASGMNGQSFAFLGYLPIDDAARRRAIDQLAHRARHEHQTQIFIETPYRNNRLLKQLVDTLPQQLRLCVASDITGRRESIVTRTVEQWRRHGLGDYDRVPTIFLVNE